MGEECGAAADASLSERTRRICAWYTRGILTENEALRLLGRACLAWTESSKAQDAPEPAGAGVKAPLEPAGAGLAKAGSWDAV